MVYILYLWQLGKRLPKLANFKEDIMSKFKDMSDDYLKRNYVPDVYQPSIHAIDYEKLKA